MSDGPESALMQYAGSVTADFHWEAVEKGERTSAFRMISQRWQGDLWEHAIVLVQPRSQLAKGVAILYITGGDPNPLDLDEAHRLADLSGLPVAHLFNIPNQPLFDLIEDDLVAQTFANYLDTEDSTWPLLLPMTAAALRAMDTLGKASTGSSNPLKSFIVTGASKRGWTSWLTAASGDPRVIGVAPMVYDNLNIPAQLQHQVQTWHKFSEMISPYVSLGLPAQMTTPRGQQLVSLVDPYAYREQLKLPKMVINGSNDPYWSVDSLSLYWDALPRPKWASVVANAGHGLGDMSQALHALAAFARSCAGKLSMPTFTWAFERDRIEISATAPLPEMRLWIAESESGDFRESTWWPRTESGAGKLKSDQVHASFQIPRSNQKQAAFAEMRYRIKDLPFSLTTSVRVYES